MARKIDCPDARAEGLIGGYPYNTELVNVNGVAFHIWLGETAATPALLKKLKRLAKNQRDVVYMTYSDGSPSGFWAHEDFGAGQ